MKANQVRHAPFSARLYHIRRCRFQSPMPMDPRDSD
jgi:hypothetical protein